MSMEHTLHTSRIVMTTFLLFFLCRNIMFWWWAVVGCLLSLSLSLLDSATMPCNPMLCALVRHYLVDIYILQYNDSENCRWIFFSPAVPRCPETLPYLLRSHTQKNCDDNYHFTFKFCAKLRNHKTTTTYVRMRSSLYLWKENVVFQVSHRWLYQFKRPYCVAHNDKTVQWYQSKLFLKPKKHNGPI